MLKEVLNDSVQPFCDLNELFDDKIISKNQIEIWFKKFKSDDINFVDEGGIKTFGSHLWKMTKAQQRECWSKRLRCGPLDHRYGNWL